MGQNLFISFVKKTFSLIHLLEAVSFSGVRSLEYKNRKVKVDHLRSSVGELVKSVFTILHLRLCSSLADLKPYISAASPSDLIVNFSSSPQDQPDSGTAPLQTAGLVYEVEETGPA